MMDNTVIQVALDGLDNILKVGEMVQVAAGRGAANQYAVFIEEAGGMATSSMSHAVLSVVLSSTLSGLELSLVGESMGLSDLSTVRSMLADKRSQLVSTHGVTNPLHSVFDRIENLPRPSLVVLGALYGLKLGESSLKKARSVLSAQVSGGECGLHRRGNRHLGCANLLHLSSSTLPFPDVDFDPVTAQISILGSMIATMAARPLKRILEIHGVDFSPADKVGHLRNI
jgi:hypothetical protein